MITDIISTLRAAGLPVTLDAVIARLPVYPSPTVRAEIQAAIATLCAPAAAAGEGCTVAEVEVLPVAEPVEGGQKSYAEDLSDWMFESPRRPRPVPPVSPLWQEKFGPGHLKAEPVDAAAQSASESPAIVRRRIREEWMARCIEATLSTYRQTGRWPTRREIATADGQTDPEELKSGRYATVLSRAQARAGEVETHATVDTEVQLEARHPVLALPEPQAQVSYDLDDDGDISSASITAPLYEIEQERRKLEKALGIDASRRMGKTAVSMTKKRVREDDYIQDVWYGTVRTAYAAVPPEERQQQLLDRYLDGIVSRIPAREPVPFERPVTLADSSELSGVIAMTDGHVGMAPVTGVWGTERSCAMLEMSTRMLAGQLQETGCQHVILMTGSDGAHTDEGRHTTGGTPQDTTGTWTNMVEAIIPLNVRVIDRLLTQFQQVDVGVILGNHGTRTDYMIGKVLQAMYSAEPRVTWQIERDGDPHLLFDLRGGGKLGLTHGHHGKLADLAEHFRAKFGHELGNAIFLEILHGHFHHAMQRDSAGVPIIGCGSLAPTDTWHGNSQYGFSDRQMTARLYDRYGCRSTFQASFARVERELELTLANAAD